MVKRGADLGSYWTPPTHMHATQSALCMLAIVITLVVPLSCHIEVGKCTASLVSSEQPELQQSHRICTLLSRIFAAKRGQCFCVPGKPCCRTGQVLR